MGNSPFKNAFKIACCFVGSVIGAGFASGQEFVQFFLKYQTEGLYGLLIASVLFFAFIVSVLLRVYQSKLFGCAQYLRHVAGGFGAKAFQIVIYLFLFSVFCVMTAGSGAMLHQQFAVPHSFGIVLMAAICFLIFLFDAQGVVNANLVLSPLMVVGILTVGIYTLIYKSTPVFFQFDELKKITDNCVVAAIVYVSYNTMPLISVFTELKAFVKDKKTVLWSALLGSGALAAICLVLWGVLSYFYSDVHFYELPMLAVTEKLGYAMNVLYIAVLYMAMITTAASAGFGLIKAIERLLNRLFPKTPQFLLPLLLCTAACPLSQFGFSRLVGSLYPFFGYAGLLAFILILLDGVRCFLDSRR